MDAKQCMKDDIVPRYYFIYANYSPEFAFLEQNDYFEPLPSNFEPENRQAEVRRLKKEQKDIYDYYMRLESMLCSIELNGIYSKQNSIAARAHYAFLSKFVHPTDESIRLLKSNGFAKISH